MSEVTPEEQAAMAVILDDKVKELVRKHLKETLEDYGFVNTLYVDYLQSVVFRYAENDPNFRRAVLMVFTQQIQK